MKKALITGITGQDGSYLAEFLIKKKYQVHGIIRRVALEDETHRMWRIRGITNKVNFLLIIPYIDCNKSIILSKSSSEKYIISIDPPI